MMKRKGQAKIIGIVLIAFMNISSIATYMFLSSEYSKYINTVDNALSRGDQREARGHRLSGSEGPRDKEHRR